MNTQTKTTTLTDTTLQDRSRSLYYWHCQPINISMDTFKDEIFELGKHAPYFRYVSFPVEISQEVLDEIFPINKCKLQSRNEIKQELKSFDQSKKCDCLLDSLMREGCKCGGI